MGKAVILRTQIVQLTLNYSDATKSNANQFKLIFRKKEKKKNGTERNGNERCGDKSLIKKI